MPGHSTDSLPQAIDWSRHALFLDFDGTLAPIVPRPEMAAIARPTRAALDRLIAGAGGAVAILTGRALADVDRLLGGMAVAAAGSHGLEMRWPGDGATTAAADPALDDPARRVAAFAGPRGLLVERKPGSVALHYRSAPGMAGDCRALVDAVAGDDPALRALHGNMVSEVALAAVHKGSALDSFMARPPFAGRRPIMAGDDVTDEDAFRAAQAAGGLGIKIGPGGTAAQARADDIDIFLDWLARMAGQVEGRERQG